ncbi:MAG: glutathione S-transferase family protein [Pseudomonadota bacterium]
MTDRHVRFYHSPQSRSRGVLALLEELGADYALEVLDQRKEQQRSAEYLQLNPLGKVPAIVHDGALVTEQVAIYIYLADLYADRGIAPALDDPRRGPYLRWMAFYGSCFEPAIIDRAQQREPGPHAMSPYGTFDAVIDAIAAQLGDQPYLLGESFTALDMLWGTALGWTLAFGLLPERDAFKAYAERVGARESVARASAIDEELLGAD